MTKKNILLLINFILIFGLLSHIANASIGEIRLLREPRLMRNQGDLKGILCNRLSNRFFSLPFCLQPPDEKPTPAGQAAIGNSPENPSASTQIIGTEDYIFSAFRLHIGQADTEVDRVRFFNNGTAPDFAVVNLELLADGLVIASLPQPSGGEALFDLSANPVSVSRGGIKDFALRGDIIAGVGQFVSFDMTELNDVRVKNVASGSYFVPQFYPNETSPFFDANDTFISAGTLTVTKGVLPTSTVSAATEQQILGAFEFTVVGEPVEISELGITVMITSEVDDSLRSDISSDIYFLHWYDEQGNIIAGPVDLTSINFPATTGRATTTDTFIVPPGSHTYILKGDLSAGLAFGDLIKVTIDNTAVAITAKGAKSGMLINSAPSTTVSSDQVTVKTLWLNASMIAEPGQQDIVAGTQSVTFANLVLDATQSDEDIGISQINFAHKTVPSNQYATIENIQLFNGTTSLDAMVINNQTATSTLVFDDYYAIPKGTSKTLTLKGDVSFAGFPGESHSFGCNGYTCIHGLGLNSGTTLKAHVTNFDGWPVTIISKGSITVAAGPIDPSVEAQLIVAGTQQQPLAHFRFSVTKESFEIQQMQFKVPTSTVDEVGKLYLFDGTTQLGDGANINTADGTARFDLPFGERFMIPKDGHNTLIVKSDLNTISQGADSGATTSVSLIYDTNFRAVGLFSGISVTSVGSADIFGQNMYLYKTVPTVSTIPLSSSILLNGTENELYSFRVTADSAEDVSLKQIEFEIFSQASADGLISMFQFFRGSTNITNQVSIRNTRNENLEIGGASLGEGAVSAYVVFDNEDLVPAGGSFMYTLKATTVGFTDGGDFINTKIADDVAIDAGHTYICSNNSPSIIHVVALCDSLDNMVHVDSFIWSDNSSIPHISTLGSSSPDWSNGYLVDNLPSIPQTILVP